MRGTGTEGTRARDVAASREGGEAIEDEFWDVFVDEDER